MPGIRNICCQNPKLHLTLDLTTTTFGNGFILTFYLGIISIGKLYVFLDLVEGRFNFAMDIFNIFVAVASTSPYFKLLVFLSEALQSNY